MQTAKSDQKVICWHKISREKPFQAARRIFKTRETDFQAARERFKLTRNDFARDKNDFTRDQKMSRESADQFYRQLAISKW